MHPITLILTLTQGLASGACASTIGAVGALITFTKHTPPLEALIECKTCKRINSHHYVFLHDEDESMLAACSILIPKTSI